MKKSGEDRFCLICKTGFYIRASAIKKGRGKFCSSICFHLSRTFNKSKQCKVCNKTYLPQSPYHGKRSKYCSHKCHGRDVANNKELKNCLICRKNFRSHGTRGKYCSISCFSKSSRSKSTREKQSLAHTGLSSKLKGKRRLDLSGIFHPNWRGGITPKINQRVNDMEWKKTRVIAYQRDNYTCQKCNKKCNYSDIACHHIIPWRIVQKDELFNLQTLCKSCHAKADAQYRRQERYQSI